MPLPSPLNKPHRSRQKPIAWRDAQESGCAPSIHRIDQYKEIHVHLARLEPSAASILVFALSEDSNDGDLIKVNVSEKRERRC